MTRVYVEADALDITSVSSGAQFSTENPQSVLRPEAGLPSRIRVSRYQCSYDVASVSGLTDPVAPSQRHARTMVRCTGRGVRVRLARWVDCFPARVSAVFSRARPRDAVRERAGRGAQVGWACRTLPSRGRGCGRARLRLA